MVVLFRRTHCTRPHPDSWANRFASCSPLKFILPEATDCVRQMFL